jgi:pilus assembly protein CpaE
MIRVLLAVNDGRLADHLAGLISESDELELASMLRDPQELRGALPRSDVDAAILHDRLGAIPLIETARELTVAHPELGLVLLVSEHSPEVVRNAMQAGARDVISEPIGLEQLEASAVAAAAWTQALRRRAARDAQGELHGLGRVVTVVGAKGGVGTTTVAVHLALAARQLGEASVCLVEYDLQAGDLRAFLDLPYRRSVVDLAAVAADELTSRHLNETLYTHASGLRVLLAPEEGEQAEGVEAAAARNILTAIRTREDLTVVDAGSTLTDASAIAAEMADTVLIVATPDVVALRGVSRLCSLWDRLKVEPPEIAVLLNRTSRKLEVPADLARRVVPVPMLQTTIPADFFALESAVNTGIPGTGAASEAMLRPMATVLGEISALPSAAATEEERVHKARSIAARFSGESGQATVEFVGVLPFLLVALVALWQIVLVGATFVFAGHAARAGAAALAIGVPVKPAATDQLPSAWRSGTEVDPQANYVNHTARVSVRVKMPLLFPGTFSLPVTVDTSAGTVIEDRALPSEQPSFLMSGALAGTPAVTGLSLLATLKYVPGNKAVLLPDGTAEAPINAPIAVKEMIAAANEINSEPYIWGGGHGGSLSTIAPGYDCSGSTSFVLYAAHEFGSTAQTSGQLESYGAPGHGNWVTIYADSGHVHIVIAGLNFDTAAGNGMPPNPPATGPRWTTSLTDPPSPDPFVPRHPPGL